MKTIETCEDLNEALERLDEIWSARPGDVDWEERKTLVDAISDYEDKLRVFEVIKKKEMP